MNLIPDDKLLEFMPEWGKEQPASKIYRRLRAAGFDVQVKHKQRRKNRESTDPEKGRIWALSRRLKNMKGVSCTRKKRDALKYFYRE